MASPAGRALVLGLTALGAACAGGEASTPLVAYRDSAGVVIAESFGPAWGEAGAWRLDSFPVLSLKGDDPAYLFTDVRGATRLPDGRLVVADHGSHEVRWYDAAGGVLLRTGRDGEGPGDFSRLTSVSRFRGDSVLAFDPWLRRATILDGMGRMGRILTLPAPLEPHELWPLGGDSLLAVTWSLDEFMRQEGDYRTRFLVVLLAADGAVLDTVARIDGANGFKMNRADGGYDDMAPVFVMRGQVGVGGGAVVTGFPDRMEFARHDGRGRLERIVRVPSLDEALSAAEIAAARAAMITERTSADRRELIGRLPVPRVRPGFSELLLDAQGNTWAARYFDPRTRADDPVLWYLFDPEGAWLGSLTTPARFAVLEVGEDYVLGVQRDELDTEQVQLLRLHRGP